MGGLKRKFEEESDLSHPLTGGVSAFAAAKASGKSADKATLIDTDVDELERIHRGSSQDNNSPRKHDIGVEVVNYGSDTDEDRIPQSETELSQDNIRLSTWRPSDKNVISRTKDSVGIVLFPLETVTFLGQFDLVIKAGVVEVYGAALPQGSARHRIFAPSSHPLPTITCLSISSETKTCEVEIRQCSHTLRGLARISPLFARIWNCQANSTLLSEEPTHVRFRTFELQLKTTESTSQRPVSQLIIPSSWQHALDKISGNLKVPKVLICGPKGTGKSTFGRILTNKLVSPSRNGTKYTNESTVCWLDLDPGQPEFTPPGQVSLVQIRQPNFGPPFTHPIANSQTSNRILRAHSIASISPKDDPDHYLSCAMDLMECYKKTLQSFPNCGLVVNCSGWVIGSALEVTAQLIQRLAPSILVYTSRCSADMLEVFQQAAGPIPFEKINCIEKNWITWPSADLRTMQCLSYFHQGTPINGQLRWKATPITSFEPWDLSYSGDNQIILAIQILHKIGPEFVRTILDGSLVSIVYVEDLSAVPEAQIQRTAEGMPYCISAESGRMSGLDPGKSHLIGLGLVCGIDYETQTISLYTPLLATLRDDILNKRENGDPRIVLLRGNFDSPGWAYIQDANIEECSRRSIADHGDHDSRLLGGMKPVPRYDPAIWMDLELEKPWLRRILPGESSEKSWKVRRDLRVHDAV